jgi:DNA uptake protein ComE-like DNA-binding protein
MKLPSIDKKIAKVIIEYRNANGNFKNITDIKNVKEITTNIFSEIEDLITVEEP